jgi:uncharacterized protein (TIGR03437 family)
MLDLDRRLDAYFATLRSPSPKEAQKQALKRSAGNWQFYAAVTGSALAMATGASASVIQSAGGGGMATDPVASVMPGNPNPASAHIPLIHTLTIHAAQLAMAEARASQVSQAQAPSISPNGVVPVYSTANTIQAGEWVSIYGSNLASQTALWNNDFPETLGGTSVTINGKAAYLLFVSPGQINLQAPDDTATGTVSVVVQTASGSATSTVTLSQVAPSFSLIDTKHVAGIILRSNGSGAYGRGTYDILGPTGNSLGYETMAAKAGDSVMLFGFGFGPTTPMVLAGQVFSGAAPMNYPLTLYINNIAVKTSFAGMSGAGLYQVNLKIPYGLGTGDVPLLAIMGGARTPAGVMITLDDPQHVVGGNSGSVGVPVGSTHFVSSFPPGGTFTGGGGTGGGGTGGGSSNARKRRFEPKKLRFDPK